MSSEHEQALASQLSTQVLAAVADLTPEERNAVRLVADTIRNAITDGEMQLAGLGHLGLALASVEFQQPAGEEPAADTPTPPAVDDPGMTALELNGAVRREIVELLRCTGRAHAADRASEAPLVDVIGQLFTEISDIDAEAQAAPKLRERVAELEQMVADTHGPMQAQLAELNRRIVVLNAEIDARVGGAAS
jgi:hypothetical protein